MFTTLYPAGLYTRADNDYSDKIIGNKVFKNVKIQQENQYTDYDSTERKVSYLKGKDADFVTWETNGQLTQSSKSYHKMQKKVFDGQTFTNVLGYRYHPKDETKTYECRMYDGGSRYVTVSKEGKILDIKSCPKNKLSFLERLGYASLKMSLRITKQFRN